MEMDHAELWRQIRIGTKVRLSIDTETLCRHPDALQFDIRYPKRRRFTIRLNGMDLYDIEFGRLNMRTFEYTILAANTNVDVEELNATLLRIAGLE